MFFASQKLGDKLKFLLTISTIIFIHVFSQIPFTYHNEKIPLQKQLTWALNILALLTYVYFILTTTNRGFVPEDIALPVKYSQNENITSIETKSGLFSTLELENTFRPKHENYLETQSIELFPDENTNLLKKFANINKILPNKKFEQNNITITDNKFIENENGNILLDKKFADINAYRIPDEKSDQNDTTNNYKKINANFLKISDSNINLQTKNNFSKKNSETFKKTKKKNNNKPRYYSEYGINKLFENIDTREKNNKNKNNNVFYKNFEIELQKNKSISQINHTQKNFNYRECQKCRFIKPERAHHCSNCNKCIKKMDHHCFWVGSCINADNLGHFTRFLFFASLATMCVFVLSSLSCLNNMKNGIFERYKFIFCLEVLFTLFCLVIFILCFLFFVTTLKSVLLNISYIEKIQLENAKRSIGQIGNNPYDQGAYNNFKEVMGKGKFLYLFGSSCDGIHWKKTYDCELWPPIKKKTEFYNNKNHYV
ncbi:palmitoyltransferase for Vac8p [Conglomerata obtusa]